MIINHPLLGPRDSQEFVYLGDAALMNRPDGMAEGALAAFIDFAYLRDNPAGLHRELWYHEQGDRSWLVVTRNTKPPLLIWQAIVASGWGSHWNFMALRLPSILYTFATSGLLALVQPVGAHLP